MPYMGKEYVKGKIGENTKMNLWKWRERVMYNIYTLLELNMSSYFKMIGLNQIVLLFFL
jgi:hypothetical protein